MPGSSILKKPLFWLGLTVVLLWLVIFSWPDKNLHLIFCNVGQGDAILAVYGQTQILIDGGPDNKVLDCLSNHVPFWDRQMEAVFLTHPDSDHLNGVLAVSKRYQIKYFFSNFKIEGILKAKSLGKGDKIKIGPIQFFVLWPDTKETPSKDINENSLVLKLDFGSLNVFLPGDITQKIEEKIEINSIDILKVAHHGSKNSTGENLLDKIKPQLAIISVGKNHFGHPTKETLERLLKRQIKTLRTDQNKEIQIISDGENWWLSNFTK